MHPSSPANNGMPVSEPPSYASTMAYKAAKNHMGMCKYILFDLFI